jgi:DNA-binding response OmpR family regulator
LDEQKAEFTKNGTIIELKPQELGMMKHFLQNVNRVISKESLYNAV